MLSLLVAILAVLLLAYILGELVALFSLPRVVGQLAAGVVLGIGSIRGFLFNTESLIVVSFLANLGAILLFYYIGLEINLGSFRRNLRKTFLVSVFNTSIPFVLGFLFMRFVLHAELLPSFIISICLSVSSQAVSLDLLEEFRLLKSKLGTLLLMSGAVDDVVELLLISIALSLFHVAISHLTIAQLLLDIMLFILIILLARFWAVPWLLKFFDRRKSSTARFTGSLIIVLGIASLSEFLHIGGLIGAMVSGIIIRQTFFADVALPNWEEHDISRSIHIIAFGFLIPLFFVWVGLNIDLSLVPGNLLLISSLLLIATIGTVGGTILAILAGGGTFKEGHILGWGMNPKGDVELVIASMALQALLITPSIFTALVMMSLLTSIISPIVFRQLLVHYKFSSRTRVKSAA